MASSRDAISAGVALVPSMETGVLRCSESRAIRSKANSSRSAAESAFSLSLAILPRFFAESLPSSRP